MKRLALALALLAALLGGAWFHFLHAPAAPEPALGGTLLRRDLDVGGRSRHLLRYAPRTLSPDAPLLIVLHGTGQDGELIRTSTGAAFDVLADAHGFSVVYPDGIGKQWNDCRPKDAEQSAINDVGFVRAIIEAEQRPSAPVFLFGYSNGGQMILRLTSELEGGFAGGALSGTNLPTPEFFTCRAIGATPPLLFANGTADPIVPFGGGHVSIFGVIDRGQVISADATARTLAERNGLAAPVTSTLAPGVSRRVWTKDGQPWIEQLVLEGGGHTVPQPRFRFARIMGLTPTFDLPHEVVAFFGLDHA